MSKKRVALALGGGAAKGLAHVGVLRGLDEDGVEVAAIAGTSMGSIVGALYARGMSGAEMQAFFESVDWNRLGRIMLRSAGGGAFRDLMRETLGSTVIEDLLIPYAAVCCDLESGDEVVLRRGSVAEAVLASSAIPGILPPSHVDGRALVDGAMVTPVPVACARTLVPEQVMAVNVLRPPSSAHLTTPGVSRLIQGTAPAQLVQRVEEFLTRHLPRVAGASQEIPGRIGVVMRSFHLMQYNLARRGECAIETIEPEVGDTGWFEFERAPDIMAEGYRAYREGADTRSAD
jgi:NTE family protein